MRPDFPSLRAAWVTAALLVGVALAAAEAQEKPAASRAGAKRWVGRVQPPADPLDPWPLEEAPLGPGEPSAPEPETPADTLATVVPGAAKVPALADSSEMVLVVRCRQILVGDPSRVAHLERLLRQGVTLEEARQSLGITDLHESRREYAVDELDPEIRAQIDALPDSGWSTARAWRGRTAFFQVLGREQRGRDTVPRLGQNLDEKERSRLASLQRLPERPQQAAALPEADYKPATVVEQVKAEFPPAANESGEVTLLVEVGRIGEVLGVRVENSTARIFEEPALTAARESKYRAAERAGFAEPGTVRLIYKFAAPTSPDAP